MEMSYASENFILNDMNQSGKYTFDMLKDSSNDEYH